MVEGEGSISCDQERTRRKVQDLSQSFAMTEVNTVSLRPTETSLNNSGIHNQTECQMDDLAEVILDSITLLICLFGLVGNGIVLWILGCHIKRNPFTVYILNLAIADFGFLLCLPVFLAIVYIYCFTSHFPIILDTFFLLSLLTYNTSLFVLTAISTERCLSVLCPIWQHIHRPKYLSATVCALFWVLSCLTTGLISFFCLFEESDYCSVTFQVTCVLSFLIFPPLMIIFNLILFIRIQYGSQRHQPRRLYVVILLTIIFFLLFAVPFSAYIFLSIFEYFDLKFEACIMLASVNSSVNPVIYFLVGNYRKRLFRGSIKVALQRVFQEKIDPRGVNEVPTADIMDTTI
ncbi:LOW QUALITY PROTEIN: mas-related G-protein coupled receptor member H-like [Alligator sinensis]|uniref:LOW QUALITY PROTEIN: mas-related G-protein coupled receptor member H-like n=1 Tax=Alligator sinensis TaxID=38654 RepID=A0A3Q0HIB6_ALLSI|nr:LOW QUALITY PROTEIN: mas-related G-protein coupled receptor member H-like [Alligator sinensis]